MNRIFLIFNRILIVLIAVFKSIIKQRTIQNDKTVLIIFQQAFGDSVIFTNSIKEYEKIFPMESGYNIKLLVQPSVLSFMKENFDLPSGIVYIPVDFKKMLRDFRYFIAIIKEYDNQVDTILVPGTSLSAEVFSVSCRANKKIGLVRIYPAIKFNVPVGCIAMCQKRPYK